MQTLPTLSIKTDYTFVVEHWGERPLVSLAGPGVDDHYLSVPETELLKLIKSLQDRCDKLEEANKTVVGEQPTLKVKNEDDQSLFSCKATAPTDAEKIATNCAHPKLADMLFYLTQTDKASQTWWNGLSARHQKNLIDCGFLHHLGIQDPNLEAAVPQYPGV